jgi:TRAF-type zinc finger
MSVEDVFSVSARPETSSLKGLLRRAVATTAVSSDGVSPLHRAVQSQQTQAVELLLSNGALQGLVDQRGLTPAQAASGGNGVGKGPERISASGSQEVFLRDCESGPPVKGSGLTSGQRINVTCPLGCGAQLASRIIDTHIHEDCPRRRVPCPKCADEVMSGDMLTHAERHCLLSQAPCPLGCGKSVYSILREMEMKCRFLTRPVLL